MVAKVQIKRSAVPDKIPLTTDLDLGELAINTYDGKVYLKRDDGTESIVDLSNAKAVTTTVRNQTGATVPAGTVVYLLGSGGNKPLIQLAQANAEISSSRTYGVLASSIPNNSNGEVIVVGKVSGINTSAFVEGDVLWLSPSTAGGFTTTKPVAPNHAVYVAIVTRSHATQGSLEVNIKNGYELEELHNVLIISPVEGDVLTYDASTGLWKNAPAASPSNPSLKFTNSSTPPVGAVNGDTWLDSTSGIKYTYVVDADSAQWVELETSVSIASITGGGGSVYSNEYSLTGTTTNATETELFIDGVVGTRIQIPTDTFIQYTADFVCKHSDNTESATFLIKGMSKNVGGTCSDVGSLYEVIVARTDISLSVDIRADSSNDSLNIYVTGNSSKTVNWKCAISTLEV